MMKLQAEETCLQNPANPERKLYAQILARAAQDVGHPVHCSLQWFFNFDANGDFKIDCTNGVSFGYVCEALDLDPHTILDGIIVHVAIYGAKFSKKLK